MTLNEGQLLHARYRIEYLVGRGGYGAVYKAFDTTLNRSCAVKENLASDEQARRQFEREAHLLARLHHPNLPRVIDHFLLPAGGQYLVMDYVEGRNLQSILRQRLRPFSQDEALGIIEQVCAALSYLHHQTPPIVHRDVKPQNIIITPAGSVMLVDFGISKPVNAPGASISSARGISPGFAAPEQYGTDPTDERSDVYSVGATLYTMLTGQPPPDAWKRLSSKAALASIRQLNGSVGAGVEQVIQRALALPAEQRFSAIDEFQGALRTAHSAAQRSSRRRRHGGQAGMAAGVAVLALLLLAGLWRVLPAASNLSGGAASREPQPTQAPLLVLASSATTGPSSASATEMQGAPAVALAASPLPAQAGADGQPQAATAQASPPAPNAGPDATAGAEATLQVIAASPPPGLNPTSTRLPTAAPTYTPEPTQTAPPTPTVPPTPFGGGGEIIFDVGEAGSRDLYHMAADGTGLANITKNEADDWTGSLSPDGRWLVFASKRSGYWDIYIGDMEQWGVSPLTADASEDHDPAWSPAGDRILFHSNRSYGVWHIYSIAPNGSDERALTHDERGSWAGAWSPDGSRIVYSVNNPGPGEIYVMNADGSNPVNLTNTDAHESAAHWSPDGSRIAFYSDRDGNREIYMMNADGSNQQRLTNHPATDTTPSWSPDGTQIIFASDRQGAQSLYLLDLATGVVTAWAGLPEDASSPIWAPY